MYSNNILTPHPFFLKEIIAEIYFYQYHQTFGSSHCNILSKRVVIIKKYIIKKYNIV